MAQLKFNTFGLSDIQIGAKLNDLKNIEPVANHPNKKKFSLWFEDDYKYYYLKKDSIEIDHIGSVEELLIVPDSKGIIIGIFIFINDENNIVEREITKTIGNPVLASNSSIEGTPTNSKLFWKPTPDINVFVARHSYNKVVRFSITKSDEGEGISPGVSLINE